MFSYFWTQGATSNDLKTYKILNSSVKFYSQLRMVRVLAKQNCVITCMITKFSKNKCRLFECNQGTTKSCSSKKKSSGR